MKQNSLLLILFLTIGLLISDVKAQGIAILLKNGTETEKELNKVRNLAFSGNDLLLSYFTGATDTYSTSSIRKVYFKTTFTGIDDSKYNNEVRSLSIYPNPANAILYIQNIPDGSGYIEISRIDGVLMMHTTISSSTQSINVSKLDKGVYVLRISGKTIKFIKI